MIGTSNLPGKRFVLWKNDPTSSKRWVNQSKSSDQCGTSSINTAAPATPHYKKPQDSWLCGKIRGCSTSAINVSSLRNLKVYIVVSSASYLPSTEKVVSYTIVYLPTLCLAGERTYNANYS